MTDVRLTALNPEDSKVYPVACNTSGELRLEKQATFDGNLDGDLTVSGSASIAGEVVVGSADFYNKFYTSGTHEIYNNTWGPGQSNQNALDIKGTGGSIATIFGDGSASFSGEVTVTNGTYDLNSPTGIGARITPFGSIDLQRQNGTSSSIRVFEKDQNTVSILANGNVSTSGDVVVGSRSKQWMLVEQGGLCHMVEQVRATTADLVDPAAAEYPKLRDVFQELNTIERCLEEVMTKLRMTEPDGWPVWDGSSNSR